MVLKEAAPVATVEPPVASPPRKVVSPPRKVVSPPQKVVSPPRKVVSPPRKVVSPPSKVAVAPAPSPPRPIIKSQETKPPEPAPPVREIKTEPIRIEKAPEPSKPIEIEKRPSVEDASSAPNVPNEVEKADPGSEESNGVGDKIKKFEKAAEDAGGRLSRPGSMRRPRVERNGSDPGDELPPPPLPASNKEEPRPERGALLRQQSLGPPTRPEPQRIVKPEFKQMPSPIDVTIRSPSLGAKIADRFPSHGTAFRNVAPPAEPERPRPKEKYQVSKGSSYFTRGSEEIWLVKKKDIEEIEERVLDSFRRAGGNVPERAAPRPASDSGHGHGHSHGGFTHATMGRKRQMYARSESLDPQWAGARAHTLKRQTSVACTCGHDKKPRQPQPQPPRPRSRSHGDDNNAQQVLDKYETLV